MSPGLLKNGKSSKGSKDFRRRLFLFVDGLDPRIHTLYFCPQLYKYDGNDKLVPLQGEEIGELIAEQLQDKVKARRPWYEPSEKLPDEPVIGKDMVTEFDTLVIEKPRKRPTLASPSNAGAAQGLISSNRPLAQHS